MKRILLAALLGSAQLLVACGGGAGADGPEINSTPNPDNQSGNTVDTPTVARPVRVYPAEPLSCELPDMRRWVNANMLDYYLFYDQVVTPTLDQYFDLDLLVQDLRVGPNDRFSYITNAEKAGAQFDEGLLFGFGQSLRVTSDRRVRISHVYPESPFANAGLKRGDYLVTINGKSPFNLSQTEIDDLYGLSDGSATMTFSVQTGTDSPRDFSLSSTTYSATTVADSRVITHGGAQVGYIAFTSFLDTSQAELERAFVKLRQQHVTELVLDLRYNRGGRVNVANKLASMILGAGSTDNTFITVALNDKYSSGNLSVPFSPETVTLDLNRVIVITTGSSCSASELVINSLRPFMEVILIGQRTCGKPYGSLGREACGIQMNALEYEFVNASYAGGYYDGIEPDCPAMDDLAHALGDPSEAMLDAALDYVTASACQTLIASRSASAPTIPPRPWLFEPPGISDLAGTHRSLP